MTIPLLVFQDQEKANIKLEDIKISDTIYGLSGGKSVLFQETYASNPGDYNISIVGLQMNNVEAEEGYGILMGQFDL